MKHRFRRTLPWVLLGILMLGGALRTAFLTSRSLWFDEAFSWRLIQYFPTHEFFSRAAADVHPILYYVLLWLWMLPMRATDPEATLFWMRAFSLTFGVLTIGTMAFAGRVLFRSRWVGFAAGLLTAVNAFQLQYAWEARMYTLGTALLPLALVGLVRTFEARTVSAAWRSGIGMGMSLGALLHVHYYALFSWFAVGATKLAYIVTRMRHGVRATLRSSHIIAAEVGFWLSVLLFLPQVTTFLSQAQRVDASYWIPQLTEWSVPTTIARLFWGGVADIPHGWAILATAVSLLCILVALVRGRSFSDLLAAMIFAVPIVLSVVVSSRTNLFVDRYFLFASLGLILLVARTLSFFPRRVRMGLLALCVGISVVSVLQFWQQLDFPAHPGARAAAAFITERADPRDPVLVSSPFAYFPLSFHLGCDGRGQQCPRGRSVRLYTETGELAHFAGAPILTPEEIVRPKIFKTHPTSPTGASRDKQLKTRLWVVDTTGFGGSFLDVPSRYRLVSESRFTELFTYQGDMIVREYALSSP